MATSPGMQRKYAKQQMKKVLGGDLVSDRETRRFEQQAQEAAEQNIAQQQAQLGRMQQALGAGAPTQSGAIASAAGQTAAASGEAAVQARGQAQDLAAALTEKRRGEALGLASEMAQRNQRIADYAMRGLEVAGQITGLIGNPAGAASGLASQAISQGMANRQQNIQTIQDEYAAANPDAPRLTNREARTMLRERNRGA
jgi:hypothetical protein